MFLCYTLLYCLFRFFYHFAIIQGLEPTFPVYVSDRFNLEPFQIGLLYTAIIVPNMVVGIITGKLSDKYGRKNISLIGAVSFAIFCPLIAFARNIFTLVIALMLFGTASSIMFTPTLPEFTEYAEKQGGNPFKFTVI